MSIINHVYTMYPVYHHKQQSQLILSSSEILQNVVQQNEKLTCMYARQTGNSLIHECYPRISFKDKSRKLIIPAILRSL